MGRDAPSMDGNALKRTAVIVIAVLFILLCVTIPVMYFVLEAPPVLTILVAVVYIALACAMAYYSVERLKEIREGLDDAVDDY